ncbi:agmatinase [Priestia flexa]|uniref:agmatinase n=1 Tax=Priestia flexa TaxID=86664 RepID=UPI0032EF738E
MEKTKFLAYSGQPTFWRLDSTRDLADVDIAVMGVPFDMGVSNRPGARFGAREIRSMSLHTGNFHYPYTYDIKDKFNIIDYGDVGATIGANAVHSMIEETYHHASKILNSNVRLLTLGGDHTIPYGLVRAASEKYGKLALIHLDSHQDSLPGNENEIFHGTFAHDIARAGYVDASKSVQVFIRTDMPNENEYNIIYANEALELTADTLATKIKEIVGEMPVYLTLDIDSLDPSVAPGTGTPVIGGPNTYYMRKLLQSLNGINVVAADLVEVSPTYDEGEITTLAAATLAGDLIYLLGGIER